MRVEAPVKPGLRMESADGRRLVLLQGAVPVLFARQRVTHRGLHYARTGRYASPLPPLRAERARAVAEFAAPGSAEWSERWAAYAEVELRTAADGPLHTGGWLLAPDAHRWFMDGNWPKLLAHDPDRGHLTWFGYGDPVEDARDLLPLRALSHPEAPRVKAYRRQYREGVLPPVFLWWISGLNSPVVLDGHDRLTAALAEGGRPEVLVLSRAVDAAWVALFAERPVIEYEKRVAALDGPLAALRIANESRRLASELRAVVHSPDLTRAWPFPGGAPAWDAAAAAHVPGWAPDAEA
ncbi:MULTISPECIES: hypothetical protein [unclassified Streptomyces]|uniref:hypothetical protein n=1 Tax=unclassified Streptomyces TaxID=2593676 RepID=UPI0006FCD586|nr:MULTISPECIES: hypothetical protein [unclassified Streptomyces]KQX51003.1 hypothetical protein ASD33_13475 [Streptomyces sp. Root1304]KRA85169.1 hypothetical protein ASE09_13480 [Streptomyces sp. Root66D1]